MTSPCTGPRVAPSSFPVPNHNTCTQIGFPTCGQIHFYIQANIRTFMGPLTPLTHIHRDMPDLMYTHRSSPTDRPTITLIQMRHRSLILCRNDLISFLNQKMQAFAYLVFPNSIISVLRQGSSLVEGETMEHGIITSVTHGVMLAVFWYIWIWRTYCIHAFREACFSFFQDKRVQESLYFTSREGGSSQSFWF